MIIKILIVLSPLIIFKGLPWIHEYLIFRHDIRRRQREFENGDVR